MQWIKTWLRKWLGVDAADEYLSRMDVDYTKIASTHTQGIDILRGELVKIGVRIESLREKMDRLDQRESDVSNIQSRLYKDLIDLVKTSECDGKRISELETLIKDATLDTALSALEDRVAVIENHPATPSTQGRRGGSAWNSHQVAAAAGAALANGVPNPIPTPGVS